MSQQTIVFISPKFPFNISESRARVIRNYLKQLSVHYNYKVVLVCVTNGQNRAGEVPGYIDRYYQLPQPPLATQAYNILVNSFFLKKNPIQNYLYWSKKNHRRIEAIIKEEKADTVISELIRSALYHYEEQYMILDLADLFSKRYKDQIKNVDSIQSIYGQYRFGGGNLAKRILELKWVKKYILQHEYEQVKQLEQRATDRFDVVTLVSPDEVEELRARTGKKNVHWVPNGTGPVPDDTAKTHTGNTFTVSFLGILNVPHNEEAVLHFLRKVFPLIRQALPEAEFRIIGKNPTRSITREAEKMQNVHVLGFVDDLGEELKRSDLFVAPLLSGSGVQTKLFEAMKYGIPVVASKIAAEGIVYEEEPPMLVAEDNGEDFAAKCVQLLHDRTLRSRLARHACHTVRQNYYWDSVGKRLYEVIREGYPEEKRKLMEEL